MSPRRLLATVAAASLAVGLTACTSDPLAQQYRAGDNKGYIAANGFETEEVAPDQRGDAVEFAGTLDSGAQVSAADFDGQVLVVNFWYAACGPCIVEAPFLEAVNREFAGKGVSFLGVNTYDQAAGALSFARDNGVTYPSILAVNDAAVKLAFSQHTPLSATPTTLVLDKRGRVAARIIGTITEPSILETIVRDTLAEQL